jgi:hypothetical protein
LSWLYIDTKVYQTSYPMHIQLLEIGDNFTNSGNSWRWSTASVTFYG